MAISTIEQIISDYEELIYMRSKLTADKKQLFDKEIPLEVRNKMDEIEEEFAGQFKQVDERISEQAKIARDRIVLYGKTVKGELFNVQFVKGRVSISIKPLEKIVAEMLVHPDSDIVAYGKAISLLFEHSSPTGRIVKKKQ